MIDPSTIERILDVADITEVIQDFVSLKKRGVNYLGHCPFHNEKTPSFTVSPSKGIFKCFGCGKGGSVVNFVMEHEQLSYPEALKFLARRYHIEIEEREQTPEEVQLKDDRESMMVLLSFAQKAFTDNLHKTEEGKAIGLSYLKERGVRDDMIRKFQLGYALDKWDAFTQHAQKEGYKPEYLIKTGLTIHQNDRKYDRFSGRIIFPIHSLSGQVIGFGGRTLKKDTQTAKYLNSPESDIYHKSRTLYGIYFAKKQVVNENKCYLVEGYTDVISLHQCGIENVVASSGTSLTTEQVKLIKRFSENIVIIYDGDEAGIKASLRGIDMILEEGLNVKVVPLPKGEDPDSFSKQKNDSEFKEYIKAQETDFIHFKTQLLLSEAKNDPVKKANLITDVVRSISVIPASITRSVYVKECAGLLQVDEGVLVSEVGKIRRKKYSQNNPSFQQIREKPQKLHPQNQLADFSTQSATSQEKEIIRILLNYGNKELFTEMLENKDKKVSITVSGFIYAEIRGDELEFESPLYRAIFEEYEQKQTDEDQSVTKHFIHHSDPDIQQEAAELLSNPYDLSKIWKRKENYIEKEEDKLKEVITMVITEYKRKKVMLALKETEQAIKTASSDPAADLNGLFQKLIALTEIKKKLSKDLGDRPIF